MTVDLAASIHSRVLKRARARGDDFNLILTHYVLERFLYRLPIVPAREACCLNGAIDLWFDVPHQPTRDADLLGKSRLEASTLDEVVEEVHRFDAEPLALARKRKGIQVGVFR